MAKDTDQQLVDRVLSGNKNAFNLLVLRYQHRVAALIGRFVHDHHEVEDVCQETFIKAYNKITAYTGAGSFKAWLCRIAYTEFLMSARKRKAIDKTMEKLKAQPMETHQAPADGGARVDLDRALSTLGEEERVCVVLCYASGLSHSDAAEVTGLPLGTVKSHVNRGKAKLKAWFERKEAAA